MVAESVVVTGYPNIQARKLLAVVLEQQPESMVSLVVLQRLLEDARSHLARLTPAARARVRVFEGDAAAIDMGLSGAEFRDLASDASLIHHVAHASWIGLDKKTAEYCNVRGAVEAVELARNSPQLRCLVHHSTALVSGDRTGVVYEAELDVGQGFHSEVQRSRMKAETVMRRAMPELPIAVVRPSTLVGDSLTGEVDRFDGPHLLVMMLLGLPRGASAPLPAANDNPFDIVPVDYAVRVAHAIGQNPDAAGGTYHVVSAEKMSARAVFECVAQAGGRRASRRSIPSQTLDAMMRTPGVARLLRQPSALFRQLAHGARYDDSETHALLGGATVLGCPPLSAYVENWVAAVAEHLAERRGDS